METRFGIAVTPFENTLAELEKLLFWSDAPSMGLRRFIKKSRQVVRNLIWGLNHRYFLTLMKMTYPAINTKNTKIIMTRPGTTEFIFLDSSAEPKSPDEVAPIIRKPLKALWYGFGKCAVPEAVATFYIRVFAHCAYSSELDAVILEEGSLRVDIHKDKLFL